MLFGCIVDWSAALSSPLYIQFENVFIQSTSLIRGGLFVFKEINIDTLILEEYKEALETIEM
ncbi:hypothetical protein EFS13_10875 [Lentilactobacillus buchneri]|nr:hypothetical protein [Lentilactobacillus buchneri]